MQALRLNVNSNSLSAIFKDWQVKALALIPNGDIAPIGSKFVWEQTNNHLQKESGNSGQGISRASVINFLEYLREVALIDGTLATGKGGKRYLYKYQVNRDQFNHEVSEMIVTSLVQEYPKVNLMHVTRVAMSEARNQD